MKRTIEYQTRGGVCITCQSEEVAPETSLDDILGAIDTHCGAIFASGIEEPGRYNRHEIGFIDPPIEFVTYQRWFYVRALNSRGLVLLKIFFEALQNHESVLGQITRSTNAIHGTLAEADNNASEEARLRRPNVLMILRTLVQSLGSDRDAHLGFYGAFGYDLVFQLEPITLKHHRYEHHADLHLFLPDEIVVHDRRLDSAHRYTYDFSLKTYSTKGLPREGKVFPVCRGHSSKVTSDHKDGEYAESVEKVVLGAKQGDFFEVVLSQVLRAGYSGTPSELFSKIRTLNPSPYEFLINLGTEQLVGASPEMFVQVSGSRVETCPISGTIKRGETPMEDAEQCQELLNSDKDKAELTICTDVDRNDKARICIPGTVKILARRLIEMYARLIHTVDHVVGTLRPEYDGLDALLAHMWAGTLTGGPKPIAMQTVEDLEKSPRRWYGGCVGMVLCNGDVKTGITIRTVHLEKGVASVRVGATLLAYSDPAKEEKETRLKASASLDAILGHSQKKSHGVSFDIQTGAGKNILLVDNCDSFVHTLGDYARQTGASVVTQRAAKGKGISFELLAVMKPDLVFISPGPDRPEDFKVLELVRECVRLSIPVFGVCLGLQGIVEAFGGTLGVLETPMHGVASLVHPTEKGFASGIIPEKEFMAGRYHSLYAFEQTFPECLDVLARTEDGIIMAIKHKELPIAAVQFHPESILTMKDDVGLKLVAQAVKILTSR